MHAEVNDRVRLELVLKPFVIRGVLRMRREIALEQQSHRIALHAERRLNADEDVTKLETSDDAPFAWRSRKSDVIFERSPRRFHLFYEYVGFW